MRITGGALRGRTLRVPNNGKVRPTQDAVREALFAMLGTRIGGARFLDLFGGTGAVGLEAVSRGAGEVVWIEGNAGVARNLSENLRRICGSDVPGRVVVADAFRWVRRTPAAPFDIVFADPPYGAEGVDDGIPALLAAAAAARVLVPGGIFVAEQRNLCPPLVPGPEWEPVTARTYGHTRLTLLRFAPQETQQ